MQLALERRRGLPGALVLLLAVASAAGCGPSVFEDGDVNGAPSGISAGDGGSTCPAEPPGVTVTESCHNYCDVYRCLGCPATAAACEQACDAHPHDADESACLACAAAHVAGVATQLSCSTSFEPVFSFDYPLAACPQCPQP